MASTKRMFAASFTGQDKLKRNLAALRREFPDWLEEANQATADEIFDNARRNIKTNDSFASGDLYDSIEVEVTVRGGAIYVGSTAAYAPFVEFGARPHFPPLDAIRRWCNLKGIPESAAFPIARKISEVGIQEAPFMRPAFNAGKRSHLARLRQLVSMRLRGLLGKAA